jgi:anaerobic selenocysteine-containing dehydrogenase
MDRRNFFKLVSAASTGVLTGACSRPGEQLIPLLVSDRELVPGEESWHPAVCGECEAGCGVIVRVMEGVRLVEREGQQFREPIACIKKIEGNPLDPVSGGKLCARGQAGVQGLYNPDRLRTAVRRVGQKGKAEFKPVEWEEAIQVAAERLLRVAEQDGTRIVYVAGPQAGSRILNVRRFLEALGAPPPVTFSLTDFPLERRAAEVYGWQGMPVYDLARAQHVLGVGADFLGTWVNPVYYGRQYGEFRQGRQLRGRLVHAESRLSITAQSADQWIPLLPGTEVFFLSAVGKLLLDQNLARQANAAPAAVLEAFRGVNLESALQACGVSERRAREIAQELGQSEAPLILAGASQVHTNSLAALRAAAYLNVMLGNVGQPGGVLPPVLEPANNRPAYTNIVPLVEKAQVLFLDQSDPAYTLPASTGLHAALEKVETIISFSPFVTDSAAYADLIFPDHHPLEAGFAVVPAVAPGPSVIVATPFVQPLYDTRATGQVLTDLANAMELDFEPAPVRAAVQEIAGAQLPWDEVVQNGGFWRERPVEGTAPGRPPARAASAPGLQFSAASFSGDATQFPFYFQPYLSLQHLDGRGANLPWMQELPDPVSSAMWGLPAEIDTQTAAKLGIRNGDLVRVESEHGQIEAAAYVHPGAIPGVVSMPIGGGHRYYGRYAGRGANPLSILGPVSESHTGAPALGATRVRLARLGPERQLIQFSPNDRQHGPWGYR